jgi:flagella basal body P-ring formation protein FlgA
LRLGDVAEIETADEAERRRFESVDLTDATPSTNVIGRRLIDLRLQLAGFEASDYQLSGSPEVRLLLPATDPINEARLEQQATAELSRHWLIPESDLQVRLAAPVRTQLEEVLARAAAPHVELLARSPQAVGVVTLQLRLLDGDRLLAVRSAQFDVARRTNVLVSGEDLAPGTVLEGDLVRVETRFAAFTPEISKLEEVRGKRLARPLAAGEPLTRRHLVPTVSANEPPVVQPRDAVRVTAHRNGLTIVLRQAEALQPARIGQLVRVRNLDSNRVVVGRVVEAGEVEIVE